MEDELELLRQTIGMADEELVITSLTGSPEEQLQELTPDLKNRVAVVNTSRKQNRMSGISNFLANPEVQNFLLQMGRAFAQNDPTEPGTILANAGEAMLGRAANQRALEAFESGGDIASSAGRFADPGLVASLQERRELSNIAQERLALSRDQYLESVRQFDEELKVSRDLQELRRKGIENDIFISTSRLNLNKEQYKDRLEQLKIENDLNERVAESEIAYRQFLISQGPNNIENLSKRTQEFLGTLQEQELNLQDQLDLAQDVLSDFPEQTSLFTNDSTPQEGLESAQEEGLLLNFQTPRGGLTRSNVRQAMVNELSRIKDKLALNRLRQESLMATQTSRLTETSSETEGEGGDTTPTIGTQENPISVSSISQMKQQPEGSFVIYQGQLYEIGPNQTQRAVN